MGGDVSDLDSLLDQVASDLGYAPFPNSPFPLIFVVKTEKSHAENVPDMSSASKGSECRIDITSHHEQTYSTGRTNPCVYKEMSRL